MSALRGVEVPADSLDVTPISDAHKRMIYFLSLRADDLDFRVLEAIRLCWTDTEITQRLGLAPKELHRKLRLIIGKARACGRSDLYRKWHTWYTGHVVNDTTMSA